WITSLDALAALRPSQVVGAHYGMGDANIISAYRSFFIALRERVAEMKRRANRQTKRRQRCATSFARSIRTGTSRCACTRLRRQFTRSCRDVVRASLVVPAQAGTQVVTPPAGP